MQKRFNYKIYKNVYDAIISGRKNIEVRLLNEKSQKIQKGDEIMFSVVDSNETLLVEVINKYIFDNIEDLWNNKNVVLNSSIDYTKEEFINVLDEIFGKNSVNNSKIVGIEFKIKSK